MHAIRLLLCCVFTFALASCATSVPASSSGGGPFRLVSVHRPLFSKEGIRGTFRFVNQTSRPIQVYSFDPPKNGKLQIRFTHFEVFEKGKWRDLNVSYCGTGASTCFLQPHQTYRITENLDYFTYEHLVPRPVQLGRISLPTPPGDPQIWSDPFDVSKF